VTQESEEDESLPNLHEVSIISTSTTERSWNRVLSTTEISESPTITDQVASVRAKETTFPPATTNDESTDGKNSLKNYIRTTI